MGWILPERPRINTDQSGGSSTEGFYKALVATDQNSDVKECFQRHRVCDSHLCFLSITLLNLTCCVV